MSLGENPRASYLTGPPRKSAPETPRICFSYASRSTLICSPLHRSDGSDGLNTPVGRPVLAVAAASSCDRRSVVRSLLSARMAPVPYRPAGVSSQLGSRMCSTCSQVYRTILPPVSYSYAPGPAPSGFGMTLTRSGCSRMSAAGSLAPPIREYEHPVSTRSVTSWRRNRTPGTRELGRSSRSRIGWSGSGSASAPRPRMTLSSRPERSDATAETAACTQGNAAMADIEVMAL